MYYKIIYAIFNVLQIVINKYMEDEYTGDMRNDEIEAESDKFEEDYYPSE